MTMTCSPSSSGRPLWHYLRIEMNDSFRIFWSFARSDPNSRAKSVTFAMCRDRQRNACLRLLGNALPASLWHSECLYFLMLRCLSTSWNKRPLPVAVAYRLLAQHLAKINSSMSSCLHYTVYTMHSIAILYTLCTTSRLL